MDTDGQFGRPLTNFKGTIRQTKVLRCALPRPFAIILEEENILFNKVKYPRGGQSNFKLRKQISKQNEKFQRQKWQFPNSFKIVGKLLHENNIPKLEVNLLFPPIN